MLAFKVKDYEQVQKRANIKLKSNSEDSCVTNDWETVKKGANSDTVWAIANESGNLRLYRNGVVTDDLSGT